MELARPTPHLVIATILSLIAGVLFNISTSEAAFGTSPALVKNDHMLPGTSFEQVVNLSRSEADKAVKAKLNTSGDEKLAEWITIENEEDLIMRKGQSILPMKVTITVPERAELRNYRGGIFITLDDLSPEALGGGQVGIALGGSITLDITVIGDKVIDYRFVAASNDPIEEGNPLSVKIKVENLGNVSINKVEGKIDIYDESQQELLRSVEFLPLDDAIPPDETNIARMIFEDTILDAGEYWLFIEAAKEGEVVYENRLRQTITKKATPVVTPEDALLNKAALPKLPGQSEGEEEVEVETEKSEAPVVILRESAPAATNENSLFLILGLAGLGFGFLAVMAVIVVLIFVLKNQQKTAIINYPAQGQVMPMQPTAPPPPPAPTPQQPQSTQQNQAPAEQTMQNSPENSNIDVHAESQQ